MRVSKKRSRNSKGKTLSDSYNNGKKWDKGRSQENFVSEEQAHEKTWDNQDEPLYQALKHAGRGNRVVVVRNGSVNEKEDAVDKLISDVRKAMRDIEKSIYEIQKKK